LVRAVARFLGWFASAPTFVRWGCVALEMAILWWASSGPIGGAHASMLRAFLHNLAHVVAYAAMGAMAALACSGARELRASERATAVAIAAAYGVIDEIHQRFVPGRASALSDVGSDLFGAVFGVMLVHGLRSSERGSWRVALLGLCAGIACALVGTFTPW
jgi:VanZ family protein